MYTEYIYVGLIVIFFSLLFYYYNNKYKSYNIELITKINSNRPVDDNYKSIIKNISSYENSSTTSSLNTSKVNYSEVDTMDISNFDDI